MSKPGSTPAPLFKTDKLSLAEWAQAPDKFDLIIDARSEHEYADDHLPGALNLPVLHDDEYAMIGTLHRSDTHSAYIHGVRLALANIAAALDERITGLPRSTRILVYCFRGGKRSKLWTDALTTIGFKTQRLEGGWKAYRSHVRAELERLPAELQFNVLCGPTGCGKTRLLAALERAGAQVLDLEAIARHRGSLIGDLPGVSQPAQKLFDSLLLDALKHFDPHWPVWAEAESKKIGAISLPAALVAQLHAGRVFRVETPMMARIALWRADYGHFERDPASLLARLEHLRPLVGGEEFARWQSLGESREITELFQRLMTHHYDRAYTRSINAHYPAFAGAPVVQMEDLSAAALDAVARALLNEAAGASRDGVVKGGHL